MATREELRDKIEWEGGIWAAICDYGISESCLPEDTPERVRLSWQALREAREDEEIISQWLYSDA